MTIAKTKMVDGKIVNLTPQEIIAREAEVKQAEADAIVQAKYNRLQELDGIVRRLDEDIIAGDIVFEEKVQQKVLDAMEEKVAIRKTL